MVYIDLSVIFALLLNSIISLACLKHDGGKWFSPDLTFSHCCIAGVQSLLPADYMSSCGLHWGIWTCQSSPSSGWFTHVFSALRSEANSTDLLSLIHSLDSTLVFLILCSPHPLMILLTHCFACLSSHFLYQHVAFKKTGVLSVKFTVEFLTGHFLACGMHLRIICWVNKWKQIHLPYWGFGFQVLSPFPSSTPNLTVILQR